MPRRVAGRRSASDRSRTVRQRDPSRAKGLIVWVRGGFTGKHRKDGRLLANDYVFNFEELAKRRRKNEDEKAKVDAATKPPTEKPVSGSRTPTGITTEINNRNNNRNGEGVESGLDFDSALRGLGVAPEPSVEEKRQAIVIAPAE